MKKYLVFIVMFFVSVSANAGHLNTAQSLALRNFIAADPVMSTYPLTGDGAFAIAILLNAKAIPTFQVWDTAVPVDNIYDAITWANLTPQDLAPVAAIPSTPTVAETYAQQLWLSRATLCQSKQFALQILLSGRNSGTVNAAKANLRGGLQDALVSIPSGLNGANKAGGWPAVQLVIQRTATVLEKLLSTGTGSTASPATMSAEGDISYHEVQAVRNGAQ